MSSDIETRAPLSAPISREDAQSVGTLLAGGRSAATGRFYASAMRTFMAWCRERSYPTVPTAPEVIADFIAHRTEHVSLGTISLDVAAISAAHLDDGLEDPTTHDGARQALCSRRDRVRVVAAG